ncbi:MAG: hypothetical protein GY862_19785 [Gammaproteobacteria bacterium]|nr:hypothetical protein [Gammaproteobacteria bacterium]
MTVRTILDAIKTVISLLGTPWLLLLSTSIPLYLKNQGDLYYRHEVLYPFLGVALLVCALAVGLFFLSKNNESVGYLLWGYYLLAPLFLAYTAAITGYALLWLQFSGCVLLLGLFVWLIRVFNRKFTLRQAASFFVLLAGVFIMVDIYDFLSARQAYQRAYVKGDTSDTSMTAAVPRKTLKKRPNIYHIIFDEYQTDMFSLTLTPEIRKKLGGFVFFPEATTPFGRTHMAFGSIFSGKKYDFKSPPVDYQKAAFNNEDTLLMRLKKAGYRTSAVVHPVYSFKLNGFDSLAYHKQVRQINYASVDSIFRSLWVYGNMPAFIAEKIIDRDDFDQLNNQNLPAVAASIESYQSIANLIAEEKYLAANNRYLFNTCAYSALSLCVRRELRVQRRRQENQPDSPVPLRYKSHDRLC